jgi:hypothetical protein
MIRNNDPHWRKLVPELVLQRGPWACVEETAAPEEVVSE